DAEDGGGQVEFHLIRQEERTLRFCDICKLLREPRSFLSSFQKNPKSAIFGNQVFSSAPSYLFWQLFFFFCSLGSRPGLVFDMYYTVGDGRYLGINFPSAPARSFDRTRCRCSCYENPILTG
ncbi:hypothetical protein BHM03_00034120, partial [Ensete ventricosum]